MNHIHFKAIDSTNAYAKAHWAELDDLSFISASYQSQGRGRLGRTWLAKEGENLLFSILIKNKPMIEAGPFLSLIAAAAVNKVLEDDYGLHALIKWPNDVYIDGKKIAGILLEAIGQDCIVIGIGINVNEDAFEGDYRVPPTSVRIEANKVIDLDAFQSKVFEALLENLRRFEDKAYFLSYYKERDCLLNKPVTYQGESYVVEGIDEEYRLLLRQGEKVVPVLSGEINLH